MSARREPKAPLSCPATNSPTDRPSLAAPAPASPTTKMNTNKIKTDGFSNPETERFFAEQWDDERLLKQGEEEKHCGFCNHCFFLKSEELWILCLNADSPYCYETLDACFTCPGHEPYSRQDSSPGEGEPP